MAVTAHGGTLRVRPLGACGRSVHPVGLGCMGFAWAYARTSAEPAADVVHAALDAGAAHLDTSDLYGPFESERLLARALAGHRREQVFVATKGGLVAERGLDGIRADGRPAHLVAACEASLLRLGLDYLDLYYLHRVDGSVPLEESWGAMAGLVARGLVRALGVSEAGVAQLDRLHAVHPVSAVQSELSVWTRGALDHVVPWCRDHGAAFVAFAPLGRGFLAGALSSRAEVTEGDFRARLPRFTEAALAANAVIVDGVRTVAARHPGAEPAQIALAWVLGCGEHVHAIPGTTRTAHLRTNLSAASLVLGPEDLALLQTLPAPVGARY